MARVLKLNTNDAKVAEIFAASQPDAIWVCQEHVSGSFDPSSTRSAPPSFYDVDTIVRVARGSWRATMCALRGRRDGADGAACDERRGCATRPHHQVCALGQKRALDGGNNDAQNTRASARRLSRNVQSRAVRALPDRGSGGHGPPRGHRRDGWRRLRVSSGWRLFALVLVFPVSFSILRSRRCGRALRKLPAGMARSPPLCAARPDHMPTWVSICCRSVPMSALVQYADASMEAFDKQLGAG